MLHGPRVDVIWAFAIMSQYAARLGPAGTLTVHTNYVLAISVILVTFSRVGENSITALELYFK